MILQKPWCTHEQGTQHNTGLLGAGAAESDDGTWQ